MGKYLINLKYILEHKKNVFKVCWKEGLYLHAFTHDLSKFSPYEFSAYAQSFYGEKSCDTCAKAKPCSRYTGGCEKYEFTGFKDAWEHHQVRNKHHWNYWTYDLEKFYSLPGVELQDCKLATPRPMPLKYIKQMLCDWEAMNIKFGGTSQKYYLEHYNEIELDRGTRVCLEYRLGLIQLLNASYSEGNWEVHCPISEVIEKYSETEYGLKVLKEELFVKIDKEFDVDTYSLITAKK